MTLRNFLDAAYAALVVECTRLGMDLQSALASVQQFAAGGMADTPEADQSNVSSSDTVAAIRNDQAMQQLTSLMGGI